MDRHASKCSTALKTEPATKSFSLQVLCLGWKTQHSDVGGEGRQNTTLGTSSAGLIAAALPSSSFHQCPPLTLQRREHLQPCASGRPALPRSGLREFSSPETEAQPKFIKHPYNSTLKNQTIQLKMDRGPE